MRIKNGLETAREKTIQFGLQHTMEGEKEILKHAKPLLILISSF